MPTWDDTPPVPIGITGITFDNTPPGSKTIAGITFDNTAPADKTIAGVTFANSEVLFLDAFTGTDAQPIPLPWTMPGDDFIYGSNKAIEDPGGDGSYAYLASVTAQNGYIQAACHGVTTSLHSLLMRHTNLTTTGYAAEILNGTVTLKRNGTTLTSAAVTYGAGKILRLECAANVITIKYDGATIITHTDTDAAAILAPGLFAIRGSSSLGAVFDDFECGAFGAVQAALAGTTFDNTPPGTIAV